MQASQECLDRFKKNPNDFIRRFVTTDETWVHYFTLETQNSRNNGYIVIRRQKSILSAEKGMDPFFWDAEGILLLDCLKKGQMINWEYYTNLLSQLNIKIREKDQV